MTALQELISWWENDYPDWNKSSEGYAIMEKVKYLLEKEKYQIEDAFDCGLTSEIKDSFESGNEFYKYVYEQDYE